MGKRGKRTDGLMQKKFRVDGKQYFVYGHNERELFEKEKEKREEIESGFQRRREPTVEEYYERWQEARRGSVKECTMRGQKKIFNAVKAIYVPSANRTFGELKLTEVNIDDLRYVQGQLAKDRYTRTVNDYMAHLNHCFCDAMKERMISYNPFCLLRNLKRTEEEARDTIHRALTKEEQNAFFDCEKCKKNYYYNVFRFAICTGMRTGEIGALRRSDVRDGLIHVERTVTRTETGSYAIGSSAKTAAGRRMIPENKLIREILEDQMKINEVLDGCKASPDDLIFKAPERGLMKATPVDREIRKICESAGIEPFSMHALRATFATRAIEGGMNPKTLQEILGHSNYNITMSLYGHCLTDTKREAMNNVESSIHLSL